MTDPQNQKITITNKEDTEVLSPAEAVLEGLTEKQRLFVEHYMGDCDFNAAQAVLAAGYKVNNNNENKMGYELLQKPKIKEAVRVIREEKNKDRS